MRKNNNSKEKFGYQTDKPIERVILFGLILPTNDIRTVEEDIEELALLVKTAGGIVVGKMMQKKDKPDSAYFIGKGKVIELKELVQQTDSHTVICDDELRPAQIRNISKILGEDIKILDRSGLILDIFVTHARTLESKIQVELAQLEYLLPRLSGMWKHLERQYGAIGVRGPGEKQLEKDKRVINRQISTLKKKLDNIERERKIQRKRRTNLFRVALVGYTNAGKSSLLNSLTNAGVLVENKLFATLDATTRRFSNGNVKVLITDTVGFIKKLPHNLIKSFRSTLAESREANLLTIVADGSHPAIEEHIKIVDSELNEINASENRVLIVNKIDLISKERLAQIRRIFPDAYFTSTVDGAGIESLKSFIFEECEKNSNDNSVGFNI
ncbi:GTPase HflX [bacterium]|nr:GTPase HflX [bacterium]